MQLIIWQIMAPAVLGALCLLFPKRLKNEIFGLGILGSVIAFVLGIVIFNRGNYTGAYFLVDNLSRFILLAITLFGIIITLYSFKFMANGERLNEYYCYILWTLAAASGAVLANHLILLLVFWGFLGLTLYLLIGIGGAKAADASKKTLIIVGGTDCLMLLGIGLIWFLTGTFQMNEIKLATAGSELAIIAFLCLVAGSFAKAGAMPLHTWVPDCAKDAPTPVAAFLPASLDKLLGIYLLVRICLNLFSLSSAMNSLLMVIGAVTIFAAVMMALIQHDLKRLLGYHAVSQVGYMVLGIGTGNPIGIAGGLFHMLNNAIYKGCLFLCGGAVEKRAGTSDLDKLGGLARFMPVTFITCLVAALAISGVPPLNGFASKWMVYQGLIELGREGGKAWIIWLVAAVFGSALTLASFMKLIHATFLGVKNPDLDAKAELREVHWTMWLPMVILAGLCILFGILVFQVPLKYFIYPSVQALGYEIPAPMGLWQARLSTFLIGIGVIVGLIIYLISRPGKMREAAPYVGGEEIGGEHRVSGVDFYETVREIGLFKFMYGKAERKWFDIYEVKKNIVFFFTHKLQKLHSGILPVYLLWCLVGMAVLLIVSFWGGR